MTEKLNIINKNPKDLINYENNNKIHNEKQIDLLANSIKEYGFNSPVVIDKNNIIIAGHGRTEASIKMGLKEIPCIIKDNLTDAQIKKYRLLDNKIAELAEDNLDNIKIELQDLQDVELNSLYSELNLQTDEEEEKELIEDDVPDMEEKPLIVKEGDIFKLGRHTLMCGDSMNEENIKTLLSKSNKEVTTHCISDPPYGIVYKPDKHGMIKNDDKVLDYTKLAEKYTNGFFCMWTGYQVVDKWMQLCKSTFGDLNNIIIWHKGGGGMGDCARTLAQDYEILLVSNRGNNIQGYRGSATWYWNQENKLEWIKKASKTDIKEVLENITTGSSIWKVGKDNTVSYVHPTQKPVEINDRVLINFTAEDENVLDLFGGSGSNLLSCEKNSRNCYMMELDPKYIQVILKRYFDYTKGQEIIECINRELDLTDILYD